MQLDAGWSRRRKKRKCSKDERKTVGKLSLGESL